MASLQDFPKCEGHQPLPARGLAQDTLEHFGYYFTTLKDGTKVHAAPYFDEKGKLVAYKTRDKLKQFRWFGDARSARLFGENKCRKGGKMICVTEGEIDAMSLSQAQANKWPVVSVKNGAAGAKKDFQASLEFLESFEKVVIMFDNDEPGQKAALECAEVLSPGKAFIATLPLKDANEMLTEGRTPELITAMWNARAHRPDGIVPGTDVWEIVAAEQPSDAIPYPWEGLNRVLRGIRKAELVTFTAGSGIGKSAIVREIAYDAHKRGEVVGYIALEEPLRRTALMFMGLELDRRVHLDRTGVSEERLKAAYDKTIGSGRFFLYDHFGSLDLDNLLSKIRYLARGCGCTLIVLDHISIAVSGIAEGDERRMIDNLMTRLRALVQELNVRMLIVSHLKRPQGTGHEEGARVELGQLRGSGSIAQVSDACVGLERDQQGEQSDLTTVRVLKNRWTGEAGIGCYLQFNKETGRLVEVAKPEDAAKDSEPVGEEL
jgi:twinkle protein